MELAQEGSGRASVGGITAADLPCGLRRRLTLRLTLPKLQSAGLIPSTVTEVSVVDANAGRDYHFYKKQAVAQLVNRSWNWLEREGFNAKVLSSRKVNRPGFAGGPNS